MADPPDGSFNLKHRLVGATVLILVAVILLPRVLTGTDSPAAPSGASINAGPQIQPQIFSEIAPANSSTAKVSIRTKIEILDQPVVGDQDEEGSDKLSDLRGTDDERAQAGEIPLSLNALAPKSVVTGWIAQVGIFQRPNNARNLISNLKMDGIDAKAETLEVEGRWVTRIWLGPFNTRSEATREGNKAMMRTHSKPIIKEWP